MSGQRPDLDESTLPEDAFAIGTASGVLIAKLLYQMLKLSTIQTTWEWITFVLWAYGDLLLPVVIFFLVWAAVTYVIYRRLMFLYTAWTTRRRRKANQVLS